MIHNHRRTATPQWVLVEGTERLVPKEPSPASLRAAPSPALRSRTLRGEGDPARGWVGEGWRRSLLFGYDH